MLSIRLKTLRSRVTRLCNKIEAEVETEDIDKAEVSIDVEELKNVEKSLNEIQEQRLEELNKSLEEDSENEELMHKAEEESEKFDKYNSKIVMCIAHVNTVLAKLIEKGQPKFNYSASKVSFIFELSEHASDRSTTYACGRLVKFLSAPSHYLQSHQSTFINLGSRATLGAVKESERPESLQNACERLVKFLSPLTHP